MRRAFIVAVCIRSQGCYNGPDTSLAQFHLPSIPFMTFRDQVILITGGSSGIGLATARRFAQEGAHVWLVARTPERLTDALIEVQSACECPDQKCGFIPADVADPNQAELAVAEVTRLAGLPDILINSHGVARPGYFQKLDLTVFREMMDINYFGALHTIRAVTPSMIKRGSGHIVNIASGAALVASFGYSAYSASKYALRGLSDVLRLELKPHNINVSVVYPPDTDTPQLAWETPYKPPETRDVYGGPVISPDSVARSIVDGIKRKRYSITPGIEMTTVAHLVQLLGDGQFSILDRLIARSKRQLAHRS